MPKSKRTPEEKAAFEERTRLINEYLARLEASIRGAPHGARAAAAPLVAPELPPLGLDPGCDVHGRRLPAAQPPIVERDGGDGGHVQGLRTVGERDRRRLVAGAD